MSNSTQLHRQLLKYLRQYSHYCDLRHLSALAWMVSALLSPWTVEESPLGSRLCPAVPEKRKVWSGVGSGFWAGERISVTHLYVPLVLASLKRWQQHRLYLALDTTMLWNRYCMIHLSVVCCGRAVPLPRACWNTAVPLSRSRNTSRCCEKLALRLRHQGDVMLLADTSPFLLRQLLTGGLPTMS